MEIIEAKLSLQPYTYYQANGDADCKSGYIKYCIYLVCYEVTPGNSEKVFKHTFLFLAFCVLETRVLGWLL